MIEQEPIDKDWFYTLSRKGAGEYKEKGSKFLGFAYPAQSVEQAMEILENCKKEFHDARHHCFAYRIHPTAPALRWNDDGEPSNSAGTPIFNQIVSADLWNVLVIVVRYFGGTKLGVSGLITAYKSAASEAVAHSKIIKKYLTEEMTVRFPYKNTGDVSRILNETGAAIVEEVNAQDAGFVVSARSSKINELKTKLQRIPLVEISYIRGL